MKKNSKGISKDKESEAAKLPFEPTSKRKKPSQPATTVKPTEKASSDKKADVVAGKSSGKLPSSNTSSTSNNSSTIPEVVSRRMARRMAFFSGIPTGLGMLTFIISYFVVSQHLYKLPTIAVLIISLGFFGLGVLGLTYGVLSASWDENRVGSWLGLDEFKTNFGRAIASWKSTKTKL
jgi:hypothetical protein